ncbi:hypothetical protein OHC33_003619 [Knufia fluminis]|uniref:Uncharacterized protein n=1 Tax=Knufia fluminis TaxID=191047 RepID=A0AAN8EIT1_9EURO|nr:hypothetical protein OHC33_003619 [Knufia fluminis]
MSSNEIYTGFWMNRSRSTVLGATWTLSVGNANILNSFLTFLITTILLGSLWEIAVISLYLARPLPSDQNPSIEKKWVILRNSATPATASFSLLKSLLSQKDGRKPRKLTLIVLLPTCLLLVLKAAGFLIPPLIISASPNELALLKPETCGFKTPYLRTDPGVPRGANAANELSETMESRRYATERYGKSTTVFATKRVFPVETLPFDVVQNEPCPFDEEMCLLSPKSAVSFDTGLLDSHTHLGINAPTPDRIQYRWRSVCTPLRITDRVTTLRNETRDGIFISGDEPVFEVNLGPLANSDRSYTFFYKQNFLDPSGYQVRSVSAIGGNQNPLNIWTPINPLNRVDADVTLVLIGTNAVTYVNKVSDPVFQANDTTIDDGLWISDYYLRIIGCADQHQYCNPETGLCTAMNGTQGEWSSPFVYDGLSPQYATGWRLSQYTMEHLIDASVRSLGNNALIAHSIIPDNSYISPGLPDNHWQHEAQRWFETGLAKFQYKAMEYPNVSYPELYVKTGDIDSGISLTQNFTEIPEVDELLSSQCKNQLVKLNGRGQNVSVLGLALLLIATAVLYLVAKLLTWWGSKPSRTNGRRKLWQQDHFLALWHVARRVPKTEAPSRMDKSALLGPEYIPLNKNTSVANSGPFERRPVS